MRCRDCPRNCGIDRHKATGRCHAGPVARVARAMRHFWEEPCISGTHGSGAIFFSGCNLGCVFCQNYAIQDGSAGRPYAEGELAGLMLQLQDEGAHNINLVTATPHLRDVISALKTARQRGLFLPIVYNTSAYERLESLRLLDGLVDIYLPDFKFFSSARSKRFAAAPDYAAYAIPALIEMQRQVGSLQLDANGIAMSGLLVRHLILPCCADDSRAVLNALAEWLPLDTWLSLMRQYTPTRYTQTPPLNRPITAREYDRTIAYALSLGFHNLYLQDDSSANGMFTPTFTDCQ